MLFMVLGIVVASQLCSSIHCVGSPQLVYLLLVDGHLGYFKFVLIVKFSESCI